MLGKEVKINLNSVLQEKSDVIEQSLADIEHTLADFDDHWGVYDAYHEMYLRWRLFDNALHNDRAEWHDVEQKEYFNDRHGI